MKSAFCEGVRTGDGGEAETAGLHAVTTSVGVFCGVEENISTTLIEGKNNFLLVNR